MKLLYILGFTVILFMFGCTGPDFRSENDQELGPNDSVFIVQKGPYHFSMRLPKDVVSASMPIIMFKEQTGDLVVSLNNGLAFLVSQELVSLSEEANRMNEDGQDIFTIKILEKDAMHILYETYLPDATPVSFHLKALIEDTRLPYLVYTDPSKRYSLEQVTCIEKIAASVSPL